MGEQDVSYNCRRGYREQTIQGPNHGQKRRSKINGVHVTHLRELALLTQQSAHHSCGDRPKPAVAAWLLRKPCVRLRSRACRRLPDQPESAGLSATIFCNAAVRRGTAREKASNLRWLAPYQALSVQTSISLSGVSRQLRRCSCSVQPLAGPLGVCADVRVRTRPGLQCRLATEALRRSTDVSAVPAPRGSPA